MTARGEDLASLMGLLKHVPSGKATVRVGGRTVVSVDADSKTLELQADGVRDAGLRLSGLVDVQEGRMGLVSGSVRISKALSRLGWRLNLYSGGDRILSMGAGVSPWTGHISGNPLKLKKMMKALK